MTDLCGEIIATQFGQTKIVHEVGSKPELIYVGFVIPLLYLRKKLLYRSILTN